MKFYAYRSWPTAAVEVNTPSNKLSDYYGIMCSTRKRCKVVAERGLKA